MSLHPGAPCAPRGPAAPVSAAPVPATRDQRPVGWWLLASCALVCVMIVLGGATRLTQSGLSMVEWRPVTGWLPPLDEAQWQSAFEQYQHYPEFHARNADMDLAGFKSIFWLEYLHRLWGRIIGLAFLLPFLYFAFARGLERPLALRLGGLFVIGAMQGLMGWVMVMSGLVDRPDVSQYRLTAHLALAFLLLGWMLWLALDLLWPPPPQARRLRRAPLALVALVAVTVVSGGFVAGTDAGFAYNTFPLMAGQFVPEHYWIAERGWRNAFENIATIQFNHRWLALTTFACILAAWLCGARRLPPGRARAALHALGAAGCLQVALGMATLLLKVPVGLGTAHQGGGVILFCAALVYLHAARAAPAGSR